MAYAHKQTNTFYKTKKWRRKREAILRRDKYECRECKRYGKTTQATTVHHIYPLEDYPEYSLTNENLYSVCNTHHESFHNKFTGELTKKGIALMKRMKAEIEKPRHLLKQ